MSTIERAMRKLSGEPDDISSPDQDETTSSESTGTLTDGEPRIVAPEVVTPTPESNGEARLAKTEEAVKKEMLESGVAEVAAASGGQKAPSDTVVAGANTPQEYAPKIVELDFDRLKTMGYLVPGDDRAQLSEEYQTIKRRLIANTVPGVLATEMPTNLIMVTSSLPSEGKTYTSMNLAISLAMEVERRVLLVDVDIIKSDLSRFFGVANRTGLFDVLGHRELGLEDVILKTNIPTLSLVPAGTVRQKITENLASSAMIELTRELAARYPDRLVIFDCPPILATSSASALAPLVGQIVLVVESCQTTRQTLNHALSMMRDTEITGVVLNKVRHRGVSKSGYYGYGYGSYGYGYGYGYGQGRENR